MWTNDIYVNYVIYVNYAIYVNYERFVIYMSNMWAIELLQQCNICDLSKLWELY